MKKILVVALFSLMLFLFPKNVFASDQFANSYDVRYDIDSSGEAQVTQKITFTNLTDRYYISNFSLGISSTTVTDISALDDSGTVETSVDSTSSKTTINVKFNDAYVGLDKQQTLTIKFKSKDFTDNLGKTWEVNLPKIPPQNIDDYNLSLSVPLSFGDPTSISPQPKSEIQSGDRTVFNFTKSELDKSGVSINFGTNQFFDFNLKYQLKNSSFFPILTNITLPPDTNYQDVSIKTIDPTPLNVTIDDSGNYLAWYRLERGENLDVQASGSAKLYIKPKNKKIYLLTENQQKNYLKSDTYWEKDNPAVKATLAEIFKDGLPVTTKLKAQGIYRYVVDTLKYDDQKLDNPNSLIRLGVLTVLNNPSSAVCMEFTDLFIALSRAANIPARELDGFAYSKNSKLRPLSLSTKLHSWPEYFDENVGWVMVDPTWENTSGGVDYFNKFDLNHFVLAIKGFSSNSPVTTDDVNIELSSTQFIAKSNVFLELDTPQSVLAGLPAKILLRVSNHGEAAFPASDLTINTNKIKLVGDTTIALGPIPPFGHTDYELKIETPLTWQELQGSLRVDLGSQKVTRTIIIKPFFLFQPFPYILGVLGLILGVYLTILGVHIYQKRIQEKSS